MKTLREPLGEGGCFTILLEGEDCAILREASVFQLPTILEKLHGPMLQSVNWSNLIR